MDASDDGGDDDDGEGDDDSNDDIDKNEGYGSVGEESATIRLPSTSVSVEDYNDIRWRLFIKSKIRILSRTYRASGGMPSGPAAFPGLIDVMGMTISALLGGRQQSCRPTGLRHELCRRGLVKQGFVDICCGVRNSVFFLYLRDGVLAQCLAPKLQGHTPLRKGFILGMSLLIHISMDRHKEELDAKPSFQDSLMTALNTLMNRDLT
ncbi:hypothetical protein EGW08_007210 [Elysia chlorotica]|uniref:Uncharacterized protein n=1 Tax=Elysia chlorotica TaxID=188477 RepID=A0A433TTY9_ELYCH|nr:hypothetical protein EGW08_007210 [Elysia chlorotica]